MPHVSTIIPAYNAQDFIAETIESALAQTHAEHEIIVVDDGSTDQTCEIVQSFGDRVCLIRQENAGPATARNKGAAMASGEWLAFLDADDLWTSEKLERQLTVTAMNGVQIVYTDRENIGHCEHVSKLQSNDVELREGDIFEALLLGNFITQSSVLIARKLFEDLGGFDESPDMKAVEDWDLWIRVAAIERIGVCREPLTKYRWHAGGISRDPSRMRANLFHVLEQAYKLPRGKGLSNSFRRRASAVAWSIVGWEAANSNSRGSSWCFFNSLLCDPTQIPLWKQLIKAGLGRSS